MKVDIGTRIAFYCNDQCSLPVTSAYKIISIEHCLLDINEIYLAINGLSFPDIELTRYHAVITWYWHKPIPVPNSSQKDSPDCNQEDQLDPTQEDDPDCILESVEEKDLSTDQDKTPDTTESRSTTGSQVVDTYRKEHGYNSNLHL